MQVVDITKNKGEFAGKILAHLPEWFGIADANAAYRRDVEALPMFGVVDEGDIVAFIALKQHTPHAFEIHVMGVRPQFHRSGMGRALVERAERHVRDQGARFLSVKTLSPSHPDSNYAKTRAFYEAMGFLAIEEFPLLWRPENPALMLLKVLD